MVNSGRSRLFWQLQCAGWTTYTLMGVAFSIAFFLDTQSALVLVFTRAVFGFLITCGLRVVYRNASRVAENLWISGIAILAICAVVSLADGAVGWSVARAINADHLDGTRQYILTSILMRWMIYWLWSLLYFGIRFWMDTQQTRLRLVMAESEARENEIRFLRAQINPHFLFNALNTIVSETDNPHTRSVTQALADYLRFSLTRHAGTECLGAEVEALEDYLKVENARFGEKLDCRVEVSPEARRTIAPIALVQPLVENAIKYGWQTSEMPLKVIIAAWVEGGELRVEVCNSGRWIPPEENLSTQTGLENLRRRLAHLYGEKASLCVTYDEHEVRAAIRLPAASVI